MYRLLALLALVLLVSACGGSSIEEKVDLTPNQLTDVGVCTRVVEDRCTGDMEVIPADSPRIYVAARVHNATIGTVVSASLRNLEGGEPLELVNTQVTIDRVNTSLDSYPVFYFTNTEPWTRGAYSVKVQVEAQDAAPVHKDFRVE
ncbi:hypothetical protein BMS3Abin01_00457 [bacterium BMS3Abin01]|nr:hypothetical protein BMS3Abin01_00457 [bacterium BMS3Abin01]